MLFQWYQIIKIVPSRVDSSSTNSSDSLAVFAVRRRLDF
jgi:hypothetical protein